VRRKEDHHDDTGKNGVGTERSRKSPAKKCDELSGTSVIGFASATPQTNDAPRLPIVLAHSQVARQRGPSCFSRHSKDTTRTISRTRISSRAM
jgi:hypothetical protein